MDNRFEVKWYGMDGKPLTLEQWIESYDDRKNPKARRVGWTDGFFFEISTVLLGIDHGLGFLSGGVPIIFETMVFHRFWSGRGDVRCQRYATLAQAKGGHLDISAEYTGWRGLFHFCRESWWIARDAVKSWRRDG